MQNSFQFNASMFSMNFIDEKYALSLQRGKLDSTDLKEYLVSNENKSNSIIKLHYTKRNDKVEDINSEKEFEVLFHNNDSLVLRNKLSTKESLPILNMLKMYLRPNEKIDYDEEIFMTIILKKIREAPWQNKLNIVDDNVNIRIASNEKEVVLWYTKQEYDNPKNKIALFHSTDRGINWKSKEFMLDSSYENVSNVIPVKNGSFFTSDIGKFYYWMYTEEKPTKVNFVNYSEKFINGLSIESKTAYKNNTIIMTFGGSIWISNNGGKNWGEIKKENHDSTSYHSSISLSKADCS